MALRRAPAGPAAAAAGGFLDAGAAGIAAFLLRLGRVLETGPEARVLDRPDQWWCVPDALRTSRAGLTEEP
ncbi:hypothetical protein Asi02nite_77210 [Asanoa siamensis]|uniref:Uncharacterized protein n=1 Tax=Asanoa siamensis TaxID=926357 RepID=A0ABQ4D4L7_9ACTN|nr:hypothetical protein Asi02nite_77210 [Asanoa siamensis]